MSDRLVVPVAPYTSAMPYSRKPEANAPIRKYLSAASAEKALAPVVSRQHVHRHRHHLEAEEQHDEVLGPAEEHHPGRGQQDQRVVLGRQQALALDVAEREQDGRPGGRAARCAAAA